MSVPGSDNPAWPRPDDVPVDGLPDGVEGYFCHRTAVSRFPRGISRFGPWLCYSPRQERNYFAELTGTFDDYLKRRSAKSRNDLRRSVRKILDRSPNALEVYTSVEEMTEFHREACEISRQTYQARLLAVGLPNTPEYRAGMEDLARRGEARGYILRDQGLAIAFAWCKARGDRMDYHIIGYLREYAALSPGTVLLYLIVQDLFEHGGFSLLDFGSGEAFYKAAFATGSGEYSDAYLFRPSWRNRWRVFLHWRVERFSTILGATLEKMGIKNKVRTAMRMMLLSGRRGKAPDNEKAS